MNRTAILAALALMLTLPVPLALAEDGNETATYGGECPPDMMCASQAPADENATTDEHPLGRPGVCQGEVDCAGGTNPDAGSSNCMDGVQEGETCDGNLYYMSGPARGPANGTCENCRDVEAPAQAEAAAKTVPGLGAVGVLAAFVAGLVLVSRRR